MKHNHKTTGRKGEDIATDFLTRKGYRILERNYRTPLGEIDIIAADGYEIVFIEVKSRTSEMFGTPEASVTHQKQKKIAKIALYYLNEKSCHQRNARFDVVAVTFQNGAPTIEHITDAFELS